MLRNTKLFKKNKTKQNKNTILIHKHKPITCNITKNKKCLKLQKKAKSNKVNKINFKNVSRYKTSALYTICIDIYVRVS